MTLLLHYDHQDSLRTVTDMNHTVVKEIVYDSFDNITEDTNESFPVPFGFAGGLHDRDTGLVHFGFREYDPFTGCWTAKDPIGFAGGDTNLYGYVLNDPVNGVDPWGLFTPAVGTAAGTVAGFAVGLFDAWWNAECIEEALGIILFDTTTGAVAGFLASGGGLFGAVAGEAGGIGLNALTGLYGIPNKSPCKQKPNKENCK